MKVNVRVVPGAKKFKIEQTENGLKVHVVEPALEGKANKKLICVLAEYYNTKKSGIEIIKGEKTRDKIVEIRLTMQKVGNGRGRSLLK